MKNLGNLMKQAQQAQQKMQDFQAKLGELEVTGESGAGLVKVTLSGKGDLRRVAIDPKVIDASEAEMLEDLIVAAHNDAKQKLDTVTSEEMSKITGGLQLPPGMKLPF